KNAETEGNFLSKRSRQELVRGAQREQAHQKDSEGDEERMDVRHLAVDQAQAPEFILPSEITGEADVKRGERDEQHASDFDGRLHCDRSSKIERNGVCFASLARVRPPAAKVFSHTFRE